MPDNSPFLGKSNQSAVQKIGMQFVCGDIKDAAWYIKPKRYIVLIAGDEVMWQCIENISGLIRHNIPRKDKCVDCTEAAAKALRDERAAF